MLFRRKNSVGPDLPPPPAGADRDGLRGAGDAPPESAAGRLPGGGQTVIGGLTRIHGALRGEGSIVVHGAVEGSIAIAGGLTVAHGGRVQADVEARNVAVDGEARGSIRAGVRVAVGASGVFEGRMATPILDLAPGSVLRGSARIAGVPVPDRGRRSH